MEDGMSETSNTNISVTGGVGSVGNVSMVGGNALGGGSRTNNINSKSMIIQNKPLFTINENEILTNNNSKQSLHATTGTSITTSTNTTTRSENVM